MATTPHKMFEFNRIARINVVIVGFNKVRVRKRSCFAATNTAVKCPDGEQNSKLTLIRQRSFTHLYSFISEELWLHCVVGVLTEDR